MTTDTPSLTDEDRAAAADAPYIKAVTGLRSFIKLNQARQDEPIGALYRLVFIHLPKYDIQTSGGVVKTRKAVEQLQKILQDNGANLTEVENKALYDCDFVLNNWATIMEEYDLERASAKAMAGEHGMTRIGEASAPTAELPVPAGVCIIDRCNRRAVLGGMRCDVHGGDWMDPAARQALLLNSFEGLVKASETAVSTLMDVMENSKRDDARVAAAREVLDRVGIRPGEEIKITVVDGTKAQDALAVIRKKLDEMAESMEKDIEDIVDAEIVDDDEDQ